LTGAPLLPVFTVRDPKAGFRVVIETPITLDPTQSSEERCVAAAGAFLRRSESWVRAISGAVAGLEQVAESKAAAAELPCRPGVLPAWTSSPMRWAASPPS
jgi:hypothetical protein